VSSHTGEDRRDHGGRRALAFTPEAQPGDYVLVHVGFALNVVDEAEARKIFESLAEMEALGEAEAAP
jgi:hydrogenase expression/formation protein HypC